MEPLVRIREHRIRQQFQLAYLRPSLVGMVSFAQAELLRNGLVIIMHFSVRGKRANGRPAEHPYL